ncbi:MAG: hypothetical protein ACI9U6_000584 [Loktanella salsilacus]|jgi:hypothetical protein|uniref:DUF4231 domain-containing protein n=1 Tax=Loktanella salsilacus TaxID=195913 RepID=UPI0039895DF0
MSWRKDVTVPEDKFDSALDYYRSVRKGMREKANHNKLEAQTCFATIIVCTLLAPLFVTLGSGVFLAKVVPSLMSVTAGGLTSWLQLRKPQRLWVLYRRAQRELEEQKANYDFQDDDFADADDRDKLLARKVTNVSRWVHDSWEGLIPEPDMLATDKGNQSPEKRIADDAATNS